MLGNNTMDFKCFKSWAHWLKVFNFYDPCKYFYGLVTVLMSLYFTGLILFDFYEYDCHRCMNVKGFIYRL